MSLFDIQNALNKFGFEVLQVSEDARQLRIMGRAPKNVNGSRGWLLVVHHVLNAGETTAWKPDISKMYLPGTPLRYAWRLLFRGEPMASHYSSIAQTILKAPKSNRVEVEEFTLGPAAARRNTKGNVGPVGTVALGPRHPKAVR